jgi:anti-sigma factor RsiW
VKALGDIMCDKERLVSYLYDDLGDGERAAFERHLRDCGDCRGELNALRGVRADLVSWSPPQPDFGFRVVREPKVLPMRASWRAWWTPAAGLAAAAVLVLAAASAIARVEITSGPQGFTVRTGWSSASAPGTERGFGETPSAARGDMLLPASTMSIDAAFVESIDRRLRALELASRDTGMVRAASVSARAQTSDAEIIRRVREMLAQSETKQQGELAVRIAQVLRDVDSQRVADLTQIQQGLRGIQRTVAEEAQGHRELANFILAPSKQK